MFNKLGWALGTAVFVAVLAYFHSEGIWVAIGVD